MTTRPPAGGSRGPVISFIGLAEGLVLAAIRHSGVSLQRVRPALRALEREVGLQHALASTRLYTDGVEILYDYAANADDSTAEALRELVVVRSNQRVFNEVVQSYLRRLEFGDDGWVRLINLPGYEVAQVVVDPRRGFGNPSSRAAGSFCRRP